MYDDFCYVSWYGDIRKVSPRSTGLIAKLDESSDESLKKSNEPQLPEHKYNTDSKSQSDVY